MTTARERHFYEMELDLTGGSIESRSLPDGFVLEPMTLDAVAAYGQIVARAYAGDHVDHQPDDDDPVVAAETIARLLQGEELGPWIPGASSHIRRDPGPIVAGIVISDVGGGSAPGRPWIADVFVDPQHAGRGLGSGLITHAATELLAAGHTRLGLAVTHGNPAIALYARLGFRSQREVRRPRPDGASGPAGTGSRVQQDG